MSAPVSSPPPTPNLPPNQSVMNMKVGDIVKAIMDALQQASQSLQTAAQQETDPAAAAALQSVSNTINNTTTNPASMYSSAVSAPPPTTITISQGGASTTTSLPGSGPASGSSVPYIPLPSTSYATPQPSAPLPAPTTAPSPDTSTPSNLRYTKRPSLPTVITIGVIVVLGVISIFLALSDTLAFFAFVLLAAFIGFILYSYGFVQITRSPSELDVTYDLQPFDTPEIPQVSKLIPAPILNEVFYIADNVFTYAQAPAVCRAYGATLASYSQVEQAYNQGAEWCGYGWSEGGIALFPTQQATFDKLQKETDQQARIKCGRPGVNGGYFDPNTQFGVNCYGTRPAKKASDTSPSITSSDNMDALVAQFQQNMMKYIVSPFNQQTWSKVRGNPPDFQLSQTVTPLAAEVANAIQPVTNAITTPTTTTPTATLLSASQSIRTPPIAPPADILQVLEELGSAPMGVLNDVYENVSEFVQEVV